MLGADNALDEEPVHTVQDDGTDVDEDVRCDSKTDIPRIVGPCYPQGHCNDSNLAETCDMLVATIAIRGCGEGIPRIAPLNMNLCPRPLLPFRILMWMIPNMRYRISKTTETGTSGTIIGVPPKPAFRGAYGGPRPACPDAPAWVWLVMRSRWLKLTSLTGGPWVPCCEDIFACLMFDV